MVGPGAWLWWVRGGILLISLRWPKQPKSAHSRLWWVIGKIGRKDGGCLEASETISRHGATKSGRWKRLFTLFDFRPENTILAMTTLTISMHHNRFISLYDALETLNFNIETRNICHNELP